jgi:ABC-type transporter lipoprotein component MlaA
MLNATRPRLVSAVWLLAVVMVVGMAVGCARSPGVPAGAAGADATVRSQRLIEGDTLSHDSQDEADYDPWQAFNEPMFAFNHGVLDRVDGALDPIGYVLPFVANRAKSIVMAVNERSLNLKLFADVEDSVLDLYSAARNGYLQRRRKAVELAADDRRREWAWAGASPVQSESQQTATVPSRSLENPS